MQQGPLLSNNWRNASDHGGRCNPPVQWNMSGKMSTKCFWNACKALSIGLLLMLIGGSMATIGYYADQQSSGNETRGNTSSNVWVKHDARGFHLNNLSYAGPIVMGVGGFIVVAACVMTFEARDSAAKVAAARGKLSQSSTHRASRHSPRDGGSKQTSFRDNERRKTSGSQLSKWEHGHKGPAETSSGPRSPISTDVMSRRALTAAFVQFSKNLEQSSVPRAGTGVGGMNRCPSAPNLIDSELKELKDSPVLFMSPKSSLVLPRSGGASNYIYQQRRDRVSPGGPGPGNCTLLNPQSLLKRQAMSVDIPDYCSFFSPPRTPQHVSRQGSHHSASRESVGGADASCDNSLRCLESEEKRGSQASMAMDLHLPDCPVTLKIKDRTKQAQTLEKSPSLQRRQLLRRQTQIEHQELELMDPCSSPTFLPHPAHSAHSAHSAFSSLRYLEESFESRSMPHSRQESFASRLSPRSSFDDSARIRVFEAPRDSIAGMANQKYKYSRAKTFDESSTGGLTKGRQKGSGKKKQRRKSDDRRRGSIPTPEATTPVSQHPRSADRNRRSPSHSREISPAGSRNDVDARKSPMLSSNHPSQANHGRGSPVTVRSTETKQMVHENEAVGPAAQSINDKTDDSAKAQVHESPSPMK